MAINNTFANIQVSIKKPEPTMSIGKIGLITNEDIVLPQGKQYIGPFNSLDRIKNLVGKNSNCYAMVESAILQSPGFLDVGNTASYVVYKMNNVVEATQYTIKTQNILQTIEDNFNELIKLTQGSFIYSMEGEIDTINNINFSGLKDIDITDGYSLALDYIVGILSNKLRFIVKRENNEIYFMSNTFGVEGNLQIQDSNVARLLKLVDYTTTYTEYKTIYATNGLADSLQTNNNANIIALLALTNASFGYKINNVSYTINNIDFSNCTVYITGTDEIDYEATAIALITRLYQALANNADFSILEDNNDLTFTYKDRTNYDFAFEGNVAELFFLTQIQPNKTDEEKTEDITKQMSFTLGDNATGFDIDKFIEDGSFAAPDFLFYAFTTHLKLDLTTIKNIVSKLAYIHNNYNRTMAFYYNLPSVYMSKHYAEILAEATANYQLHFGTQTTLDASDNISNLNGALLSYCCSVDLTKIGSFRNTLLSINGKTLNIDASRTEHYFTQELARELQNYITYYTYQIPVGYVARAPEGDIWQPTDTTALLTLIEQVRLSAAKFFVNSRAPVDNQITLSLLENELYNSCESFLTNGFLTQNKSDNKLNSASVNDKEAMKKKIKETGIYFELPKAEDITSNTISFDMVVAMARGIVSVNIGCQVIR